MTKPRAPLTPADCDLRKFPTMPLHVVRLRDSDFAAKTSGEGFRAGVLLWAAAWHQLPAASLPDDDRVLAGLAGFGRFIDKWLEVKDEALDGFIACSDGRLYHEIIAELALDAWIERKLSKLAGAEGNLKRHGDTPERRAAVDEVLSEIGDTVALLAELNPEARGIGRATEKLAPRGKSARPPSKKRSPPEAKALAPRGKSAVKRSQQKQKQKQKQISPPNPPAPEPDAELWAARLEQIRAQCPGLRDGPGTRSSAALRRLCDDGLPWECVFDAVVAVAQSRRSDRPLRSFTHPAIAEIAEDNFKISKGEKIHDRTGRNGSQARGMVGADSRRQAGRTNRAERYAQEVRRIGDALRTGFEEGDCEGSRTPETGQ